MGTLVINCGSSSVKFALFEPPASEPIARGIVERIGAEGVSGVMHRLGEPDVSLALFPGDGHAEALSAVLTALGGRSVEAVGHRVVHGGDQFDGPVRVDDGVLAAIRALAPLAPLHNIPNAIGIEAARKIFPDIPHVAVFDTAFHQTIPPHIHRYAIPDEFLEKHRARRYGFHGTSHAWVAARAVELLRLPADNHRLLTAHLGNGCSATAILNGCSVDTSMGLTPLEGLVMGTRSGNVDPNLHSYLALETGLSLEEITRILNHESGLAALAGTNDMRGVSEACAAGNERARLALDMFCFRLARELAGLCAALGGVPDALVFTGGIGENSALVRAETVARLGVLNLRLDPEANARGAPVISHSGSRPAILVIPTNEEFSIAQATTLLS